MKSAKPNTVVQALTGLAIGLMLGGCAQLHHAQLGDIDNRPAPQGEKAFDVKVSETGVSTREVGEIGRLLARNAVQRQNAGDAALVMELFQMGPRTGNPVWDDTYADNLIDLIRTECPSGDITGLMAVRETRKYPVISGEIVKVTGYCRDQHNLESKS